MTLNSTSIATLNGIMNLLFAKNLSLHIGLHKALGTSKLKKICLSEKKENGKIKWMSAPFYSAIIRRVVILLFVLLAIICINWLIIDKTVILFCISCNLGTTFKKEKRFQHCKKQSQVILINDKKIYKNHFNAI